MTVDLTGRSIIITGASAGIGAATAVACARAGMNLVLNARRPDKLEIIAAQCRALGREVECVVGDVIEPGMSVRLLDTATARFGAFYAVYANAGYGFHKATHELTAEELKRIFAVNVLAGVELLSEAARRLLAHPPSGADARADARQPHAHLLMCSSALAKFTLPYFAAYSATKAAQNHFCRAMRLELRAQRIEVSCVHPITTETEFFDPATLGRQGVNAHQPKMNAPSWMVQKPQVVADAIVRCLRRPRPEVWTSAGARWLGGLFTIFPGFFDWAAGRTIGH